MSALLEVRGVKKSFGGIKVLTGVDFTVNTGEIVGLLGPNGCGKSTALNLITGYTPADGGTVLLDGKDITRLPHYQIAELGVRRTFQFPSMPSRMTVFETAMTASVKRHGLFDSMINSKSLRQLDKETRERARYLLEELLLTRVQELPAMSLSGGQKKLLGIVCALMESPRLLLLDEPMAGVHPNLRADLTKILKDIGKSGVTLIIIEHDMNFIAETCDRSIVLNHGTVVADCHPSEMEHNEHVVEAYLGTRRQEIRSNKAGGVI